MTYAELRAAIKAGIHPAPGDAIPALMAQIELQAAEIAEHDAAIKEMAWKLNRSADDAQIPGPSVF